MDGKCDMEHRRFSRRTFLAGASAVGAGALLSFPWVASAEPPPETTKLRLQEAQFSCIAPQYAAQELLYSEGFTEVQYIKTNRPGAELLAEGEVDINLSFIPSAVTHLDAGGPVVVLAGSHIGCVELVASNQIRSAPELKGKTIGVWRLRGGSDRAFISMFVAHVGLDPEKDINWVSHPGTDLSRLFVEGKIDAFMSISPFSQELRARKIGRVLVDLTTDKPWSQYFCCMVASTKEFVRKHPVATKRALRAIVKAADVCAAEPERIARLIEARGPSNYDYVLQMLKEIPYGKWREYDAEDAVRFYALRMRDVGMISSTPAQIIGRGTDWRFINELKKELKA